MGEIIAARRLPGLVDVRDESTDDVRLVLEVKKNTSPELVMAYLAKHTSFQSNVTVNLTCLVPSDNPHVPTPRRLDIVSILRYFLDFRFEVVTRRLQHELNALEKRLHILDGFLKVFDALDEIIQIIRQSDGRKDATEKVMARFELDLEQTDAILELRLYRLAKLEILVIQEEADAKSKQAQAIREILGSTEKRWELIEKELEEVQSEFAVPRQTRILSAEALESVTTEFNEEDFIIDEDALVILTAQGWVKTSNIYQRHFSNSC